MYDIKVLGVMQMLLFYISSEDANFSEKEIIMKLTGDLKNQVEKAESKDEKKKLIEEAGMELTEKELDMVSGGGFGGGLLPEDMFRQVG